MNEHAARERIRGELIEWFRDVAGPLAPAYEGALRLLGEPEFPSRLHLICHLVRDISDRLPQVLDVGVRAHRVSYEEHLDEIAKIWGATEMTDPGSADSHFRIEPQLFSRLNSLIEAHRQRRSRAANFELLLNWLAKQHPYRGDLNQRVLREFKKTVKWFMERAHLAAKPLCVEEAELQSEFDAFERVLHSFVGNFFTAKAQIDGYLSRPLDVAALPTEMRALKSLLSNPHYEEYFFSRLNEPGWVVPLEAEGFFKNSPDPLGSEAREGRYHRWPASAFLSRVAGSAPGLVAPILRSIETKNPLVGLDFLTAALELPVSDARHLVPQICQSLTSDNLFLDHAKAVQLVQRLTEARAFKEAFTLFDWLLAPAGYLQDWRSRMNGPHFFESDFLAIAPDLAEQRPHELLRRLLVWLEQLADAERHRSASDDRLHDDRSWIWRPAIEDHEQNRNHDFASVIVTLVRDQLESFVRSSAISLEEILDALSTRRSLLCARLRLHLIASFAAEAPVLGRLAVLERDAFSDFRLKHEYVRLLSLLLASLADEDIEHICQWIDAGDPRVTESHSIEESDPTATACRQRRWKLDRLSWLGSRLKGRRLNEFESLLTEFGAPDHPDFNHYTIHRDTWTPPISIDQLRALPFEKALSELMAALKHPLEWPGDIDEIIQVFGAYVEEHPIECSRRAAEFDRHDWTLIREVLHRFAAMVRAGTAIEIAPIIVLCENVVSSQHPRSEPDPLDETSRSRVEILFAVIRFLESLCARADQVGLSSLSDQARQAVGRLLIRLSQENCEGSDIQPADIDVRTADLAYHGTSTVRGAAVDVALDFFRWTLKHRAEAQVDARHSPFDPQHELCAMLDWHLEPGNETVQVNSVLGLHFGVLYSLFPSWATQAAHQLFDLGADGKRAAGWYAWNSFLRFHRPHRVVYEMLRPQYAHAVSASFDSPPLENKRRDENPMYSLAEHLVLLYARGELTQDGDRALFHEFMTKAQPEYRLYAIEHVGAVLSNNKTVTVPPYAIERLQRLWEEIWPQWRSDRNNLPLSGHEFGGWFISRAFPAEWSLQQMRSFTEAVPSAEPAGDILKQLAETDPANLAYAIRVLQNVARGNSFHFGMYSARDAVRTLLKKGVSAGGNERKLARKVADDLGRRGFLEFQDLAE